MRWSIDALYSLPESVMVGRPPLLAGDRRFVMCSSMTFKVSFSTWLSWLFSFASACSMEVDEGASKSDVCEGLVPSGGSVGACELDCFGEAEDAAAPSSGMPCALAAVDTADAAVVVASSCTSGSAAGSGADVGGFDGWLAIALVGPKFLGTGRV